MMSITKIDVQSLGVCICFPVCDGKCLITYSESSLKDDSEWTLEHFLIYSGVLLRTQKEKWVPAALSTIFSHLRLKWLKWCIYFISSYYIFIEPFRLK